jgi:CubicO group peptidase (beta-lactamase class C family)
MKPKPLLFPTLKIIISIALFISCKSDLKKEMSKEINMIPEFFITQTKDTLPNITPSYQEFPRLSDAYLNKTKDTIAKFIERYFYKEDKHLSFLVAKNGQIIYEKYKGYANKNRGTTIGVNTPLHIASVSKVITATAILALIDAKKIELDQKVNTIITDFPYPKITIKHLLNHRSGMRNYAYFVEDKGVWDRKKVLTNEDILTLLVAKKIQLQSPTDTKFFYCNTNYTVLASIIERITKMSYAEAIKKMIFEPLKMEDSYVFEYDKHKTTATPSYKGKNMEIGIDYLDAVYGDKNIYSTPRDLLKFDMARGAPQFLNPELNKAIYVGYSHEKDGEKNYGLGIRMINWKTGQSYYFHNGWWHGNTSSFISLQKENTTIIALSNKFSRVTYVVRQLAPLFGDYPIRIDDKMGMPEALERK